MIETSPPIESLASIAGPAFRSLAGIPAVVTGASRGIGALTAQCLAALEAPVAVVFRKDSAAAEQVAARIEAAGGSATTIPCDVGAPSQIESLFRRVEHEIGSPGILVNNAGIHRGGRVQNLPLSDWDDVIRTDLTGAFLCIREAVPYMQARGWGRIVNVSSVIGLRGFPGDSAYAAAKAGLLGMTKALALELGPMGITVNAIAPGFTRTDMTQGLSERAMRRAEDAVPVGRQADPEEIARAISFLVAGPDYLNGSTLVVDGGWTGY